MGSCINFLRRIFHVFFFVRNRMDDCVWYIKRYCMFPPEQEWRWWKLKKKKKKIRTGARVSLIKMITLTLKVFLTILNKRTHSRRNSRRKVQKRKKTNGKETHDRKKNNWNYFLPIFPLILSSELWLYLYRIIHTIRGV